MRLTRPFNGWLMSGRIHPKPRRGNYHPKISELSGQSCDCLSQPNQPRANLSNIFLPGISATTLVNFSSWSRRQTRDRILGNKLWERHCAWCRNTEMILFLVTLVYKITCLSMDSSAQAVWPAASCMPRYMFFPLWTMLLYLLWRSGKTKGEPKWNCDKLLILANVNLSRPCPLCAFGGHWQFARRFLFPIFPGIPGTRRSAWRHSEYILEQGTLCHMRDQAHLNNSPKSPNPAAKVLHPLVLGMLILF